MMRPIAGGIAIALFWLALLAVFCEIPLRAPLRPTRHLSLPGSAFDEKFGRSHSLDDELTIDAPGPAHSALQMRDAEHIRAADWRILRYRVTDLPRTMEVSFVFRRADGPEEKVVSLPWPANGYASFDLNRFPDWKGEITEMGLSESPTALLVPPELGFQPFSIDRVELQTASWQGALEVKANDWFGYWPWALMSISALGPDAAAPRGRSLVLLLMLGAVGTVGIASLAFGWRSRRLMLACLGAAVAVWVLLDLRWLANLAGRHAGTRQIYAGKTWEERQALVSDSQLFAEAARAKAALANAPRNAKVFVDARSDYERARLVYHLLPLNTGPLNVTGLGTVEQRRGSYFVAYGLKSILRYDLDGHALIELNGTRMLADVVMAEDDLAVYRFIDGDVP